MCVYMYILVILLVYGLLNELIFSNDLKIFKILILNVMYDILLMKKRIILEK